MKHAVTKKISMTMALILLLTAFAGCGDAMDGNKETTPSVNAGQTPKEPNDKEEQDDSSLVFTIGDLEPLSKEKHFEIEEAWSEKMGYDLLWGAALFDGVLHIDRYYGTYNDRTVILTHSPLDTQGEMELAGKIIVHPSCYFNLFVYCDGEFHRLNSSNQYEWFTESDLLKIVEYHNEFEEYYRRVAE